MPINSSHEFTPDEINLIESTYVELTAKEDGRKFQIFLTLADVRQILSDFSVNAEGSAELELDTAISAAIDKIKRHSFSLTSYIQNEVPEEVAKEGEKQTQEVKTQD